MRKKLRILEEKETSRLLLFILHGLTPSFILDTEVRLPKAKRPQQAEQASALGSQNTSAISTEESLCPRTANSNRWLLLGYL